MTQTDLSFLREGALTHNVSQERPGAFTLTPRTPASADRATFQKIIQQVEIAERQGLIRYLAHCSTASPDDGVDLIFVVIKSKEVLVA